MHIYQTEYLDSSCELLNKDNQKVLYQGSDYFEVFKTSSNFQDKASLHTHSALEIIFCHEGSVSYLLGDVRYHLTSNSIVIVPPNIVHAPLSLEKIRGPYTRTTICLSNNFYHNCLDFFASNNIQNLDFFTEPNIFSVTGKTLFHIEQLYDSLLNIPPDFSSSELYKVGIFCQLLALLHQFHQSPDATQIKPEKLTLLDDILKYINDHFSETLNAGIIAQHFYISESSVRQLLKSQMNFSLHQYIIQRRLIEGKKQISNGVPLKKLPELCGFSDYSAFYKAFTKEYGISPKEYQKNLFE